MHELNPSWDKWYSIKEILSEMAENVHHTTINSATTSSAQDKNDEQSPEQVMEPMLLEDYEYGKVPQSIKNIVGYLQNSKEGPPDNNDLIVGFIYILMLEAGFTPLEATDCDGECSFNYRRLLQQTKKLIGLRTSGGAFYLDFKLVKTLPHNCNVICLSTGDDLIVNCIVKGEATFTLMLDPLGYFTGAKRRPFQNLDKLSRKFKSSISHPAKVAILRASNLYYPSLEWTAPEIKTKIMAYLDMDSVYNLARTCTALWQSSNCVALWIKLLNTYFRQKQVHKTGEELQFLYETLYEPELAKIMFAGPDNVSFSHEEIIKNSQLFFLS